MFEDWDPDAFPEEYRDAPRHPEYPPDEYDHYPKDYVYKSMEYYGGDIPSKSFQYIETKTPVTEAPNREEAVNKARERRRSRRRQRDEPAPPPQQVCWSPLEAKYVQNVSSNAQVTSPREADVKARTRAEVQVWKPPSPTVDEPLQKDHVFDEEAYLSGYVPIMGGDPRPVPRPKKEKERAPWENEAEHHEGEFDEEAYLTGKKKAVSTGITLKQIPKRELSLDHDERYPEHQDDKEFDEDSYLAGKVSILGGEGSNIPIAPKGPYRERAPWEKATEDEGHHFDEDAYLTGKVKVSAGNITLKSVPQRELVVSQEGEEENNPAEEFDEDAYLSGKMGILGGVQAPVIPKAPKERAPWERDTHQEETREFDENAYLKIKTDYSGTQNEEAQPPETEFDEDAYLAGKMGILGGCQAQVAPKVKTRERAPWERHVDGDENQREFNEDDYLGGRVTVVEGLRSQGPRVERGPKERAPWEKEQAHDDRQDHFDEDAYLTGKKKVFSGGQITLRQVPQTEVYSMERRDEENEAQTGDQFDEDAYLSGKITILGGSGSQVPVKPKGPKERAPWEVEQAGEAGNDQFDEDAYLSGQRKTFTAGKITLRQVPAKEVYSMDRRDEENEAQTGDQFDEDAYLSGKVTILGGSGSQVPIKPKEPTKQPAPWEVQKQEESGQGEFDEDAYLGGQRSKVTVGNITLKSVPMRTFSTEEADQQDNTEQKFDENAYLSGKMSILGGGGSQIPYAQKQTQREKMPWERDTHEENQEFDEKDYLDGRVAVSKGIAINLRPARAYARDQSSYKKDDDEDEEGEKVFDEDAYLSGRIPLVKGGEVDKEAIKGYAPQKKAEQLAPWQRATDEEDEEDKVFDERAYLQGTMTIGLRDSVDREGSLRRGSIKEKEVEQRPSWVKDTSEDDEDPDLEAHFSEQEYLSGRMGPQAVPSRAFRRLSRSLSRSESREGSFPKVEEVAQEEENGPEGEDEAFDEFVYVGKKIPSKLFSNLDNITKRVEEKVKHKGPEDPLDKLRKIVPADRSIDIDHAIETLAVDEHHPEQYLNKLKQSVDQKDAKTAAAETNKPTEEKPAEPAKCQTAEVTTTETTTTESKTVNVEGSSPGSPAGVKKKKKIIKKVVKKSEKTVKETKSESNAPDKVTSY